MDHKALPPNGIPEPENAYADSGSSPPAQFDLPAFSPLDNPTEFKTFAQGLRDLTAVLRCLVPTEEEPVMKTDFTVSDHGSIFLLTPVSDLAADWVDSHLPQDAQHFGDSIVVEHRYIAGIIGGIQKDGLTVEESY